MDGGLTLAAAFTGLSTIVGAYGSSQGQKYEAFQAKQRAQAGRIQADQVDAAYRDELSGTLNNIRAIRASTGAQVDSPTGLAIREGNIERSDRSRTRDVANRNMQANQDEADARFKRSSANFALFGGVARGLTQFAGA